MIKTAAYYDTTPQGAVRCRICPHNCRLTDGDSLCGCREIQSGQVVVTNYGEMVTLAEDPIEKKPLYHFHPGNSIISTGTNGCNLECLHCQNWSISQCRVPTTYCSPEQLAATARERDSLGVAFTYTEPTIWFEYIRDVAPLLQEAGRKVVLVTNGYINPEPLNELLPFIDAANVDLKAMRNEFYKEVCGGSLQPVLASIRAMAAAGVHLEITNLIIPNRNDTSDEIRDLVDFVADVSDTIPLHFSAYRPDYKLNEPPTPAETLVMAHEIAAQRLKYVFLGNVVLSQGNDSRCPHCGHLLVERSGYRTRVVGVEGGQCTGCGRKTGIVQ